MISSSTGTKRFPTSEYDPKKGNSNAATFDLQMLRMECAKFDLCFTCEGIDTCDTHTLSRRLRKDLPHHRLATLIEELGIDGVNSHDALDETLACAGVLFKLLEEQA